MNATYSDTTHGRFMEHMDLAMSWLKLRGRRTTEQNISRTMDRMTASELRVAVVVLRDEQDHD